MAIEKAQVAAELILGGLFIYASLGKILFPGDFTVVIQNYKLLPDFLVKLTAISLPWIEFIFGTLLVLRIKRKTSAAVLSSLLVIFIVAITINLIRGINIQCGCIFQSIGKEASSPLDSVWLIIRDLIFLLPGVLILISSPKDHH